MTVADFHTTAAQVIPILGLAIVFEVRAFASRTGEREPGSRHVTDWLPVAGALIVLAILVNGEIAALFASGAEKDRSLATVTALFVAGLVLCLGILQTTVKPLVGESGLVRIDVTRNVVVVIATVGWLLAYG